MAGLHEVVSRDSSNGLALLHFLWASNGWANTQAALQCAAVIVLCSGTVCSRHNRSGLDGFLQLDVRLPHDGAV